MPTKWRDAPFTDYQIHRIALGESGEETGETYNYYLYIHATGQAIIMREKEDETEYKYANSGLGESQWNNRISLTYTNYDQLI